MSRMRLTGFLILLLSAGISAGAETVVNTPGAQTAVGTPKAQTTISTPAAQTAVGTPKTQTAVNTPAAQTAVSAPGTVTAVSTPPGGRPIAVVEKNAHTFPAVMEGEEVKYDFVIRNVGDAPLMIEKVGAG
jgi:hypothetical protein